MTKPNNLIINKLQSIITEEEGKREEEGLPNCCRWKGSGRCGPDGGGTWSRRQFLGAVVKAGRTAWFLGTVVKVGRTTRFPGATLKIGRMAWFPSTSMWRRSEVPTWRHMRRTQRRERSGGRVSVGV
jgi:hypothetical protein